jgi:DNA-binding transcriptional MerR regulator
MSELMTISELARRTGVTTSTLRFYDELGLVRPTRRVSGHRRYAVDAVAAVAVVRLLREVGFTLEEAKQSIASGKASQVAWRELAARKSEQLRDRITREESARKALEHALACPEDHLFDCPNFWAAVNGVLAGGGITDGQSDGGASAVSELKSF